MQLKLELMGIRWGYREVTIGQLAKERLVSVSWRQQDQELDETMKNLEKCAGRVKRMIWMINLAQSPERGGQ